MKRRRKSKNGGIFRRSFGQRRKGFRGRLKGLEAYILGIPFVELEKEKIDFAVLSLIPEPIARNHNIVAYRKNKDDLEVAMLDPEDLGTIDFIKRKPT